MAECLAFLLGKDPATNFGGDMTMVRTMRAIADREFDTEIICLSDSGLPSDADIVRVAKPPLSWPGLAARAVTRRRSALHTRFDVDGMREAIEASSADRFVVEHCHVAEPFLRAALPRSADLLVSVDVLESSMWGQMYGLPGALEARRIRRDERRVLAAASGIGSYDRTEVDELRAAGLNATWLPMTLPPAPRVDTRANAPVLVMLGHRGWAPNADAARTVVRLWPRISAGIDDAELWLIGAPPATPMRDLPPGVSDLGFVDDVDAVLGQARAMTAPVAFGGGVRVKLLEAAARGIPAVCTAGAVGSIESLVGFKSATDEADFVARCRTLLVDGDAADAEGLRLHSANAAHFAEGQDAVAKWLRS